ncbi:MAG: trypsin-like peptidase domain-containing protein [Planctomycetes bacterium]|nr:trypsin-like peptidase domain-containing protein [Planctomycetota bacterium]
MLHALLALAFLSPFPLAQHSDLEYARVLERSLDSVYMLGIVRRSQAGPEAFEFIGTGWVIAAGKLATNAHVAQMLLSKAHEGRLVAKRSWSDRGELALRPSGIRVHPAYAPWNARLKRVVVRAENDPAAARSMNFIPVADVALCEVASGTTAAALPVADPASVQPALSEPVVYLGFPHENISGFPTAHAVPGHVTAKTDFFFQRAPWPDCFLIHWCGPVVGGASGSPMLNRAGQVIGMISAAENNTSANGERTSFGFAYGQRVDLARELLGDNFESVQRARDESWSRRIAGLLIPPDEFLAQAAAVRANEDGVVLLDASNAVLQTSLRVSQQRPGSLTVQLESGFRYGFLAAARDGSDIDARVSAQDTDLTLGEDSESDYYPIVWIGPFDEPLSVRLDLGAAELLLGETDCAVHVYRYQPQLAALARPDENGSFFRLRVQHAATQDSATSWRFAVQPGASLMFSASSPDGYDIDLFASLDGEIVASDESPDAVPVLFLETKRSGTLEVRLRIPQGMPAGTSVDLSGMLLSGPKPRALAEARQHSGDFAPEALSAMLDGLLEPIWDAAGVVGTTRFERVVALDLSMEFLFDIPAGALGVFTALAPLGEDIDLQIERDGELVFEDSEPDANPLGVIEAATTPQRVVVRLWHLDPQTSVSQVIVRYCVID